jgi:uncharacterized protein YdeI (YjbR/CyaY-like superfamily)|tara:strand:- start:13 stop:591 length:579 start_codon:yes stop_codon:yes gene_type:complete
MTETHKKIPAYYFENVESWGTWLSGNHDKSQNIWLILYKDHTDISTLNHAEALDIALCWGWINSKKSERDENSYYLFFAKRNPKSNWSRVNKNKIEVLLTENRLESPGLVMIESAKKTGTWTALDNVENLVIPHHLKIEFDKNPKAWGNFEAFPYAVKRATLEWLFNAKRVATRLSRAEEIVTQSALNEQIF